MKVNDLVEVRTGDTGTPTEWRGPGVVMAISDKGVCVYWCNPTGMPTGGGIYPGAQDVRAYNKDGDKPEASK